MAETRTRSIAKAISWRTTGTLDTFVLSWLITGHAGTAGGIAVTEVFTKLVLYYLHERVWLVLRRRHRTAGAADSHGRSLAKAVSWRLTGSADTFLIGWVITGHAATAGGIAATELLTKIVLFYLHERAWAQIHWGRVAPSAAAEPEATEDAPVALAASR
jgi:uncharacterized membrane protein